MSTPPKLQMSDIPQELIEELRLKIKADVEKSVREELQKIVHEEVQKQLPRGPFGTSGLGLVQLLWESPRGNAVLLFGLSAVLFLMLAIKRFMVPAVKWLVMLAVQ
ncbi:hypothetical protein VOLCADRAFT_107103 [Volvox carteri f. nagariensis]|uniref:Uncharacterized protein n=1 Tax=Volvox carteri f. nagariensis TaxID=3068 RepID=D8UBY4_VOLCA|nr:uncharacterized protein VOLCADRAFT_107103 [Volvox carteri f. nagariensis]EFJ42701.1 hypothetical protein VOLCADRAFT_107103 [Volvox carteri f. nagariensis]|eukprot:XP_002956162.1 hypothetical protein VOLCADRAFT_107103 [Volvox carteri f. nagariensis]